MPVVGGLVEAWKACCGEASARCRRLSREGREGGGGGVGAQARANSEFLLADHLRKRAYSASLYGLSGSESMSGVGKAFLDDCDGGGVRLWGQSLVMWVLSQQVGGPFNSYLQ